MLGSDTVEETAKDYSQYLSNTNVNKKLESVNKAVEDMLSRLEEFETMLLFLGPDVKDSSDILKSLQEYRPEFDSLCQKIDSVEFLLAHIKNNLDTLEAKLEDGEAKLGATDAASTVTEKVSNMFTPLLFKKLAERKPTIKTPLEMFKTEEYFK